MRLLPWSTSLRREVLLDEGDLLGLRRGRLHDRLGLHALAAGVDALGGRAGSSARRCCHEGRRLLRERRERPLREDRRVDGAEARLEPLGEVDRTLHAVLDVAGLRGEGVG